MVEKILRALVTGPRGFVGARIMDEPGSDAVPSPSLRSVDEEGVRHFGKETFQDE